MISCTRRRMVAALALWPAWGSHRAFAAADCVATLPQIEGPYFKPGSPERHSLVGTAARVQRVILSGRVVSSGACRPWADAMLEFWHADETGEYDNAGYSYRGHQRADAHGRYRLETIVPGIYPGRTRHIHVKVRVPGRPALTTQLYFPGDPGNRRDPLYRRALEVVVAQPGSAHFDFVV